MTKYYLITISNNHHYLNYIYKYVDISGSSLLTFRGITLCDIPYTSTLEGGSVIFGSKYDEWIDVTNVLNKIIRLKEMILKSNTGESSNRKANYMAVKNFKQKFEKGIYPDEKDFEIMENLWKKYNVFVIDSMGGLKRTGNVGRALGVTA